MAHISCQKIPATDESFAADPCDAADTSAVCFAYPLMAMLPVASPSAVLLCAGRTWLPRSDDSLRCPHSPPTLHLQCTPPYRFLRWCCRTKMRRCKTLISTISPGTMWPHLFQDSIQHIHRMVAHVSEQAACMLQSYSDGKGSCRLPKSFDTCQYTSMTNEHEVNASMRT